MASRDRSPTLAERRHIKRTEVLERLAANKNKGANKRGRSQPDRLDVEAHVQEARVRHVGNTSDQELATQDEEGNTLLDRIRSTNGQGKRLTQ